MNANGSRRSSWLIPAGLIALCLVPALAGMVRLAELGRGAAITPANARFFAMPVPVVMHILSVIPFSILGALQFSPLLRQRHPRWHRGSGRVLIVAGLTTALSGLWMTQFYAWPAGDGVVLYALRLLFGSAMLIAMLLSINAIRRRDFAAHGAWMARAYAIAMGAGTQVLTSIPYMLLVGKADESTRAVLMGAGWIINVCVAEWSIRRQVPRTVSVRRVPATVRARCRQVS
jgi:uncharacterized membrane protein